MFSRLCRVSNWALCEPRARRPEMRDAVATGGILMHTKGHAAVVLTARLAYRDLAPSPIILAASHP